MTGAEAAIGDHQASPLAKHFDASDGDHQAQGVTKIHREDTGRYLRRLAAECSFGTLADLRREALGRWLARRTADGMSARTRNAYRKAMVSFCNWCVSTGRLAVNPFERSAKANEKAEPRRQRRAMIKPGLVKLLAVATERPLLEALTVRKGPGRANAMPTCGRKCGNASNWLGRERALIYKTLVLSGLRKGELASFTVADLHLDEPVPFAPSTPPMKRTERGTASRCGMTSPRTCAIGWPTNFAACKRKRWGRAPRCSPGCPPTLALHRPEPAGEDPRPRPCCRRDRSPGEDRRQVDHRQAQQPGTQARRSALRTTFGTLLSKGGVAPRTAQAAMRHSDIRLTMGVYTDPKFLDVRGTLEALPTLTLERGQARKEALQATGTDGRPNRCTNGCTSGCTYC